MCCFIDNRWCIYPAIHCINAWLPRQAQMNFKRTLEQRQLREMQILMPEARTSPTKNKVAGWMIDSKGKLWSCCSEVNLKQESIVVLNVAIQQSWTKRYIHQFECVWRRTSIFLLPKPGFGSGAMFLFKLFCSLDMYIRWLSFDDIGIRAIEAQGPT